MPPSFPLFLVFFSLSLVLFCLEPTSKHSHAHPPTYMFKYTHMHKFTYTHRCISIKAHIYAGTHAEGQHNESNLIGVFMCSVPRCPCLFPPLLLPCAIIALPLRTAVCVICKQPRRETPGQKCALAVWAVQQKVGCLHSV